MNYKYKTLLLSLITFGLLLFLGGCKASKKAASNDGFVKIFNGKNWDGWYHKLKNGNDELAKEVFSIEDGMVHVFKTFPDTFDLGTGANATHGLFYTKKKYSKYIFKFEYKWGTKIGNNFNRWQYDAGCYYHVIDDKIWPTGIEYQVRFNHTTNRNHTADLIRPNGTDYKWYKDKITGTYLSPNKGGVLDTAGGWMHLAAPPKKVNNLNGQWNQCEIIVMGSAYAIHKLNGEVVNVALNLTPGEGIIGLQSETAEIFYRNIQIKEFNQVVPIEEFIDQ
ncbi:MAG: hypothetical protein Sapg2KO_25490 [Saprospiraceae bacterium]